MRHMRQRQDSRSRSCDQDWVVRVKLASEGEDTGHVLYLEDDVEDPESD